MIRKAAPVKDFEHSFLRKQQATVTGAPGQKHDAAKLVKPIHVLEETKSAEADSDTGCSRTWSDWLASLRRSCSGPSRMY